MPLLIWGEEFKVNVKEIDDQHQRLVNLINKLHDHLDTGDCRSIIEGFLQDLANYAQYHFETEEYHMNFHRYPDIQSHKAEHENFISKLGEFRDGLSGQDADLPMKTFLFLCEWLKSHVLGTDKKFGPFFNEKGLT